MTTVPQSGMARVIAACFALSSFAVAISAGLAAGAPAAQIMLRACVALMICYFLGLIAGSVCQYLVEAHVEAHQANHPIPTNAPEKEIVEARPEEEPIVV